MTTLKVVTYNIHKAVGPDRRYDPIRVLRVLNAIDADVAVLQEADRRLGRRPTALPRRLIEKETDYSVIDLARTEVSIGWHGNAILAKSGLRTGPARHIDIPGLEPRGAVSVVVGGITVVGTHLGLLRYWRQKQMHAILDRLNGDTDFTLIAGDFNEWSKSLGFEPWLGDFDIVKPGLSFHSLRPMAALDRFATGKGLTVLAAGVFHGHHAKMASDHMPVWAKIAKASGV